MYLLHSYSWCFQNICFTMKFKKNVTILFTNIIAYIQKCISLCKNKPRDNKRCSVRITLRLKHIPATIVALENPVSMFYIFSLCICSLRYSACNVHALYCHLWPAWL
jgi:hypothetical protein